MFAPHAHLDLDPDAELPPIDYTERIFRNDRVEAAYRRWFDHLLDYPDGLTDDDLASATEVAEEVLQVLDDARLLEYSKVHLSEQHRYFNQDAAGEAAFYFDADVAHDSRKIECHLRGGDGYVGTMALLVRLRNHDSAKAYRDDPVEYAKWIGRNVRGAYEDYYEMFRDLLGFLNKGSQRLIDPVNVLLLHASSYPHFFSGLVKKLGKSAAIAPWEIVTNVGPNKLHFLLRTSEKG